MTPLELAEAMFLTLRESSSRAPGRCAIPATVLASDVGVYDLVTIAKAARIMGRDGRVLAHGRPISASTGFMVKW